LLCLHDWGNNPPPRRPSAGKFEAAQKVARGYLPEPELRRYNAQRAREAEAARNWKEAERGYVAAGNPEAAIAMYSKNKCGREGVWDWLGDVGRVFVALSL
jgi:hypothetical protein